MHRETHKCQFYGYGLSEIMKYTKKITVTGDFFAQDRENKQRKEQISIKSLLQVRKKSQDNKQI